MRTAKFTTILIVAILGLHKAVAQEIETLPTCGERCFLDTISMSQFSNRSQQQLCYNTEFIRAMGACLKRNCNAAETQVVLDAAAKQCDITTQDSTPALRASSLVAFGAAMGAFIVRLISKCLNKREWGADDTFMSLAMFLTIPLVTIFQLMISNGVGRELSTVSIEQLVFCLKMFFFQQVAYTIVLSLVKASILAFYLQIFQDRKFRITVWVTQFINIFTAVLYSILTLLQKNPISLNWSGATNSQSNGHVVLSDKLLYLTHSIISLALDIWMVILPLTQLYHLGLKLRKKIGVMSMFSCGILIVGTSVTRFYYLAKYQIARDVQESVKAIMWAYIELCMGVVVGCMPNIRQLTRRAHTFIRSRRGNSNTDPEQDSGIFMMRSLEYVSNGTTTLGSEKETGGTASSVSAQRKIDGQQK
ncbi:hypothetical protein FSHL1_012801 [Fusarium sambucinum]